MNNEIIFSTTAMFCLRMNQTNSSLDKISILEEYKDNAIIKQILYYVYSPFIKFNITSKNILKHSEIFKKSGDIDAKDEYLYDSDTNIFDILSQLNARTITGNNALNVVNSYIDVYSQYKDIILNIIDKDLKIRVNAKTINKVFKNLIPEFSVSLCNVYTDKKDKVDFVNDEWYCSRKLDGVRLIVIIDEYGNPRAYSRQGIEFNTLDVLLDEIKSLQLSSIVLDGECCIIDEHGNEDFQSIMREIRRKDYTIQNPCYMVYDFIPIQDFYKKSTNIPFAIRVDMYNRLFNNVKNIRHIKPLKQQLITNENEFNIMMNICRQNNWEGLVLRKNDTVICKRSDSMLKVKDFKDSEYKILDVEFGDFRVIKNGKEITENILTNIIIEHNGCKVSVGSGFTIEQREYFKEHPNELIGQTVTVQYFEETIDKNGNTSLRFPTVKALYKSLRDI